MLSDLSRPRGAWPRAALFDLDGTLIDSVPDITLAVGELMVSEGLAPFAEQEVREMVGLGLRVLVQRAFERRGRQFDEGEFEVVIERMREIYPRHLTGRTTLLPGVVECLDDLAAAGCAIGLVTNKMQGAANVVLDHFELSDRFSLILGDQSRPSGLAPKPAPDMLLFALSRFRVAPRDAIMVGDSAADMQSAAAAGTFSVAVRGGYSDVPLEQFNAGVVIDSLLHFPLAIEAWRRHG